MNTKERRTSRMQATAGQAMVIENGDHSLEIKGDVVESIRALEQVIAGIQNFFWVTAGDTLRLPSETRLTEKRGSRISVDG
jgi:hypothetical protein